MKTVSMCYVFASDSNPSKVYQTLQYNTGETSCECPGWTRRCVGGIRTCKHTRTIDAGMADKLCVSKVDYNEPVVAKRATRAEAGNPVVEGRRKFDFA